MTGLPAWLTWATLTILAAHLLILSGLLALCAPAVRSARRAWLRGTRADRPESLPSMAMIVPLTGDAPGMERCLESLLDQPGVDCPVYFVVRDERDAAVSLVRRLMPGHAHARLVVAGPASTCCQKNHSLLAGIDAACATRAAGGPDILIFCDSTHEAAPDFLVRLTAPLAQGKAVLTTAYHRVVPGDARLATLCHFYAALAIHLLQSLPLLVQPWGGATAILRREFLAHGVDAVWARGVVDDFTMGPYLQGRGVRALAVPEASLTTPLAGQTFGRWWSWWFRQLLYLKFCMPGTWLAVSAGVGALCAALCLSVWAAANGWLLAWLHLALLCALGGAFGALSQTPLPLWRRCLGFVAMQLLTLPCFLATWTTNSLRWRGIRYEAGLDGTVRRIVRTEAAQ